MNFKGISGNNGERFLVQRFPESVGAATTFIVTLGDVKKHVLDTDGLMLSHPKVQEKQKRHERSSTLEIQFDHKVKLRELRIDFATSEVTCIGQIDSSLVLVNSMLSGARYSLTTYYPRKDKKKVLHAYFELRNSSYLAMENVLARYDRIFCVDTNCVLSKNKKKVAVTSAIIAKPDVVAGVALGFVDTVDFQGVVVDPPGNPEVYGIWTCFSHILKERPDLLGDRIALITDTEYGLIRQWQLRQVPFINGMMLSEGIDIFYATSDAGGDEFMPNRLIKTCDQRSAAKLKEMNVGSTNF